LHIHAESDAVLIDERWPESAMEELRRAGFDPQVTREVSLGRPAAVSIDADGGRHGGADPLKPYGIVAV
jgi:hypothetical protein